jgi:hypothetical protein
LIDVFLGQVQGKHVMGDGCSYVGKQLLLFFNRFQEQVSSSLVGKQVKQIGNFLVEDERPTKNTPQLRKCFILLL